MFRGTHTRTFIPALQNIIDSYIFLNVHFWVAEHILQKDNFYRTSNEENVMKMQRSRKIYAQRKASVQKNVIQTSGEYYP